MGKPSAPRAPDPYQTAGADFGFNNLNQYTPYGSMEYQAPTFTNTGTNHHPIMTQTGQGSATMNLSPEIQALLNQQLAVSGGTLQEALRRLPELSNLGALPSPDRGVYEKALFDQQRGLLDPVFADQERAMRDRLSNQGLPAASEAYGFDQNQFLDNRNQQYGRAALDSTLNAGNLMGQDISNAATLRAIPFNEIASLLGLQQVQMPQAGSFQPYRGADFTGAQALQTQAQQQNYQSQMGSFNNLLGGLFGLGNAGIGAWGSRGP